MIKNGNLVIAFAFFLSVFCACRKTEPVVNTGNLLVELTDLERLTRLTAQDYKTVQFSSYDRRSKTPSDTLWFANEDGFGGEPLPGFEKVLVEPDSTGTGTYLICDIRQPGVIQRLWTAAITGQIRFFIDDELIYEGNASDFFWNPIKILTGISDSAIYSQTFRQFDANYLPIPFAKSCRIEWIGKIKEPHFYHVGVRIYNMGTNVESFSKAGFSKYVQKLSETNRVLVNPESLNITGLTESTETEISPGETKELFSKKQSGAIDFFGIKINAQNLENTLRQVVLSIFFDDAENPQVHAPLGDFFGAAPGLNPYQSLSFSVLPDSSMECRFIMPFQNSARIEISNLSGKKIKLETNVNTRDYDWKEGESMYFGAHWKIQHNLTAYNIDAKIYDIQYVKIKGAGRMVGAAAYVYNPSQVPTSWGNWWGEGDEKIFADNESFPSFFGTGSEDYYNYSWSSPKIFSHAFCGQPRNDGPNNRGYVSNFKWHIADDIPFKSNFEFNMELRHHGVVTGFSYGSIVYYYTLPGAETGFKRIEKTEIRDLPYFNWSPVAYLGCAGFNFTQAEKLVVKNENATVEKGKIWAEEFILSWIPKQATEKLVFRIPSSENREKARIGLTLAHYPGGGIISFVINGKPIKFDNKPNINLEMKNRTVLDNHFSELVDLKKGDNELVVEMPGANGFNKVLFDFMWLLKPKN
jgi:hypothetical protein